MIRKVVSETLTTAPTAVKPALTATRNSSDKAGHAALSMYAAVSVSLMAAYMLG
jgi:hypothetical protein